jgi:hypothetical protein
MKLLISVTALKNVKKKIETLLGSLEELLRKEKQNRTNLSVKPDKQFCIKIKPV